jgi:hypothetical protein
MIRQSFILFKSIMSWGKARKVWERIKGGVKKAFGWIKENLMPIAKIAAPIIGGALGGPEGAVMVEQIVGGVDKGLEAFMPKIQVGPKGGNGLAWKS